MAVEFDQRLQAVQRFSALDSWAWCARLFNGDDSSLFPTMNSYMDSGLEGGSRFGFLAGVSRR